MPPREPTDSPPPRHRLARAHALASASILTLALAAAFTLSPRFPLSDFDMFGLSRPMDSRIAVRAPDGHLRELSHIKAIHCPERVRFTPRGDGLCGAVAPDPDREGPLAELLRQRAVAKPLAESAVIVRQIRYFPAPRADVATEICVVAECSAEFHPAATP